MTPEDTDKTLEVGDNTPTFSISELSQALKTSVEERFSRVRVRGEISGFKRASSGHLYMALKDSGAVLDGVCWRGGAGRLGLAPEDGMEVIATGRLTTYPGRSKYQIVIDRMELAGQGALLKLLEDRRKKLAAEGLFDEGRKRGIPFLPETIGVVTSPTGAVIRDILRRLEDRFPRYVLLAPVRVQGEGAAAEIAAAIGGFSAADARPDVLIVARGGGSLEDLWAFNEEIVVRAAAECSIPLISAIGHETDTTLIDYASDRRAPTPTAAAEMAVPVRAELMALLADNEARLTGAAGRRLRDLGREVEILGRALPDPKRRVQDMAQRLDDWSERFGNALQTVMTRRRGHVTAAGSRLAPPRHLIAQGGARLDAEARQLRALGARLLSDRRNRLAHLGQLLDSYSYERVLDRGFALVIDGAGSLVGSVKGLKPGDGLSVKLKDGEVGVAVTGSAKSAPKPKSKNIKSDGRQESLF